MKNLILVVEDSDVDFEAFCRAMRQLGITTPVCRVCDGEEALDYLHQRGKYQDPKLSPRPSLVLLDLNLPGTDGRDVIKEIKQDNSLKMIPIVVLTTSSSPRDIETCYYYGTNNYLVKPMGFNRLKEMIAIFHQYWFKTVTLPVVAN